VAAFLCALFLFIVSSRSMTVTTPHHHKVERLADHDNAPLGKADASLLLTPAEAAIRLRVRESWLRKRAAARAIPCTFLGKHLRFSETDLAAIVAGAALPAGTRRRRHKPTRIDLPSGPGTRVHAQHHRHHSQGSS
jgi:excisionase family DNA binding protein